MYDITVGDNGTTLYANVVNNPLVKQAVVKINGSIWNIKAKIMKLNIRLLEIF